MLLKFFTGGLFSIEVQCQYGGTVGNIKALIQKEKDVDLHDHEIVGVPLFETGLKTLKDSRPTRTIGYLREPLYCVTKPWPQVPINVKNGLTGKTITVEAYPFHTIADLKAKIEDKEGFKIDQQRLLLADQDLKNKCTLDDCNISTGCTLFLIPGIHTHKRCQVSITIPSTRETLSLVAEPTTTIGMIKAEVESLGGIPRELCALRYWHYLKNDVKVGEIYNYNHLSQEYILHLEANRDTLPNVAPAGWFKLLDPVPPCGPFLMPVYVCQSDPNATYYEIAASEMSQHTLVMEVYPTITVEEFKTALHHRDGISIPPNEMQLSFSNEILEPCDKLMDYSITRGSVLHVKSIQNKCQHYIKSPIESIVSTDLTPSILPSTPSSVPVLVQIPGRSVTPVVCSPNTTVGDVKKKIARKEGISMKHQHLVFAGRLLENDHTLKYYSVRRENTINVMLSALGTESTCTDP